MQSETGPTVTPESDIGCGHVRRIHTPEGTHPSTRNSPGHSRNPRIIGVEDGDPVLAQPFHKFCFSARHILNSTKFTQVRAGHHQHHGDIRGCDGGEVGKVADMVGTHFRHEWKCLRQHEAP